jgi:DNA-binding MarR family transcriptional regulator
MSVDGAQSLLRGREKEAFRGQRIGRAKAERRREHAPHIDALIRLVSVRVVRVADLILRIGKITFGGRFGLKPTDLRILIILGAHQPISVNEVSRRTHIDKAWISRSLRSLLRRKLVKKTAHPADSRASSLSLTRKGEALLRKIAPVAQQYQRQLLQGQRRRDVERVLDLLAARAEEMYQRSTSKKNRTIRQR